MVTSLYLMPLDAHHGDATTIRRRMVRVLRRGE
jgi:hypothetical protein